MPQELNPAFVSDKSEPWKAILPLRQRRDANIISEVETPSTMATIKSYSRIITCIVLAFSALVEITVYLIETYAS
ncbi:unnamed protein product [Parnassius apollo]|uniref:(apollo) hypothetical protein n=1 Tax=Parnassius apollo TaxID=110799 RepID=A0A8S3YFI2_PARAO|nr:unnamed protein product [Parnassius apollo]